MVRWQTLLVFAALSACSVQTSKQEQQEAPEDKPDQGDSDAVVQTVTPTPAPTDAGASHGAEAEKEEQDGGQDAGAGGETGSDTDPAVEKQPAIPVTCTDSRSGSRQDMAFGNESIFHMDGVTGAHSIGVLKDDRIILAGGNSVVGLDKNGKLDGAFAINGQYKAQDAMGNSFHAMAIDSADGIIVVGHKADKTLVTRLTREGKVDQAFGFGGIADVDAVPNDTDSALDVAFANNGKFVVVGYRSATRFTAGGSIDTTFGGKGVVLFDASFLARAVTIAADGSVFVGGASGGSVGSRAKVQKLKPDGSLDSAFATGGTFTMGGSGFDTSRVETVGVLADGSVILGGYMKGEYSGFSDGGHLLAKLKPDGTLDETFGQGGIGFPFRIGRDATIRALQIGANGTILALGEPGGMIRFDAAGLLDKAFNKYGTYDHSEFSEFYNVGSFATQSDGWIVIAAGIKPSGATSTEIAATRICVK